MVDSYALLVLKDGTSFYGRSIGAEGKVVGEVVFNTSMTGYQEIVTDPSYSGQIVAFTYPHIGNVGINMEDQESGNIQIRGLIIRCLSNSTHHYLQKESLLDYLNRNHIIALADIDTRKLTHLLRDKGTQIGCIITSQSKFNLPQKRDEAVEAIVRFCELQGQDLDLARKVSSPISYCYASVSSASPLHIVAYDFGVKRTILTMMSKRNCKITVVPAITSARQAIDLQPDGIFLSNGPGDPAVYNYAISAIITFLKKEIPLFGICLGYQLLALALGARTVKMKFGHHGSNHPVKDLTSGKIIITAQNHGFAVDETTLPTEVKVTHRSLFDNSLQGICHKQKPVFGFQGHPEASPGPHDITSLFDQFIQLIAARKQAKKIDHNFLENSHYAKTDRH